VKHNFQRFYKQYIVFVYLFCNKFFADAFNSFYIFLPTAKFSLNITYEIIDQGFLEFYGSTGIYSFIESLSNRFAYVETTTLVYRSLLFVIFAIALFITILLNLNTILLALSFISIFFLLDVTVDE
jgi:hypothetical protein